MRSLTRDQFIGIAEEHTPAEGTLVVPIVERLLSDQLTPVLAYRRLVSADERTAPSFLLESVEGGARQGRYSMLGAQPALEVIAHGHDVEVIDHHSGSAPLARLSHEQDPLDLVRTLGARYRLAPLHVGLNGLDAGLGALPLIGGWVGYAAYDTVRYAEPAKLARAPNDDRKLPDLHFGLYDSVAVFDHVDKLVSVIQLAFVSDAGEVTPGEVYDLAARKLESRIEQIERHSRPLPSGRLGPPAEPKPMASNTAPARHAAMVERALEYIRAGDIFQVVLGQRFERKSPVDPFDVYRVLRAVNPSPYMVYMQAPGCILVASSPEILCRVSKDPARAGRLVVTNRPLAGTRRRGRTPEEDKRLEAELLADHKERAEHAMLVDLGRNDVGRVAEPGSITIDSLMEVERYSHVMHISSTVRGLLREGNDCWDALRAALPVGTISGAPKIRAMQIIDELEPVRRGPYGGGMGYVGLDGQMDIALTLRTIVAPTALWDHKTWTYHIQASGGIVADSDPDAEFAETVSKAAALARAIDAAENAFGG